jgi:predicted AlkP superfamily pyrophosphatase or phosphodiesterase
MENRSNYLPNSFLWAVYALLSLLYLFFGSIHLDEGAYLYASRTVYQGNLPYSDFFFLQPPLFPYVYGLIQNLFPGLLSARLTSIVLGFLTTFLLFKLASRLSDKRGATIFLALMTMTPFQIYFFTIARLYSLTAFFIAAGTLLLFSEPNPRFKNSAWGLCAFSMALGTRLTTLPMFLLASLYVVLKGTSVKKKLLPPLIAAALVIAIYTPFAFFAGMERFSFNIVGMNLSLHANDLQANVIQKARATFQLLRFYFPVWILILPLISMYIRNISVKKTLPVLSGNQAVLWILTLGMVVFHSAAKLYQVSYQTIVMPLLFCLVAVQWRQIYAQSTKNNKLLYRGLFVALWVLGLIVYGRTSLSITNGKPALIALWEQAAFVKHHTQPGDLIFSADSPLVPVESNRDVLQGMAGSDLFPEWTTEKCRHYGVLNFEIMSDYVRKQSASMLITGDLSFNISLPYLEPVSESERHSFITLIDKYYEIVGVFPNLMLPGTQSYYRIPRDMTSSGPEKLLLFGIDAIGWDVLLPLIESGELPTIETLYRQGVSARMKTLDPTVSVVLWTTIATGLLPERHGIDNWLAQSSDASGQQAITSDKRSAHAFWNLTGSKRVSVVNWWATWPVEPVNGLMISNRAHFADLDKAVYPEEAKTLITNYTPTTKQELENELSALNPLGTRFVFPDFIGQMLLRDRFYLDMAYKSLFYDEPVDILAVFVRGIDILGHEYLRDVRQDVTSIPEIPENMKGILRTYYQYLDKWLDKYLSAMGPNTGVIIVSDHGMEPVEKLPPFVEGFNLDMFLSKLSDLSSTESFAAQFKDNHRYPIGLKRGLSWVGNGSMSAAADRLVNVLKNVKFSSGNNLFVNIRTSSDPEEVIVLTLSPDPVPHDSLIWKSHHIPMMSVTGMIIHPRSGQHWNAPDGVFLISGSGISPDNKLGDIHICDIMPTFMGWLGLSISRDLDGKPKTEYFNSDLIKNQPIQWVESYGQYQPLSPTSVPEEIDIELRRELESLGYIHIY